MNPQLAVDFDSTLFPLLDAMNTLPGGEKVSYADCHTWDHLAELCGGVPQMLALLDQAMTYEAMNSLGDAALYPGAHQVINHLHDSGVSIHIVTARPDNRMDDTERFLRDRAIPFESIKNVEASEKVQYCIERGIHVIVDDHPETLVEAHEAGDDITALTLNHIYCANTIASLGIGAHPSWHELGPAIEEALAKHYRFHLSYE